MKIIRTRAGEFGVDPQRIGSMGFSAGGHLAGVTAYQPARALYAGSDRYEAVSARFRRLAVWPSTSRTTSL